VTKVVITAADAGRRLDKYLLAYLSGATRSFVYKLLRKKRIKLNGKRAEGNELLVPGDNIDLHLSQDTLENSRCENCISLPAKHVDIISRQEQTTSAGLLRHFAPRNDAAVKVLVPPSENNNFQLPPIVYEDENLLIINKPAGMASHGGMKAKTPHLLARVLTYLRQKGDYPPNATFTPALCNRLDVNTSGLVICGKNYQAIRAINTLFATPGGVEKQYLALVEGHLAGTATLTGHYNKDTATNTVRITQSEKKPQAITKYKHLSATPTHSLISVNPITGRSHQIRAHLAAIGHPLAGDRKYGGKPIKNTPGQLLHCNKLILTTPLLSYPANTAWEAEPPANFQSITKEFCKCNQPQ